MSYELLLRGEDSLENESTFLGNKSAAVLRDQFRKTINDSGLNGTTVSFFPSSTQSLQVGYASQIEVEPIHLESTRGKL